METELIEVVDNLNNHIAMSYYEKHKIHMKTYANKNKEKLREYRKNRYLKMKLENPEKHKEYLERQRTYYSENKKNKV